MKDSDVTGPDLRAYYVNQLNKHLLRYQPRDSRKQSGPEPDRSSMPILEGPLVVQNPLEGESMALDSNHLEGKSMASDSTAGGICSEEQEDVPQLMITYEDEGISHAVASICTHIVTKELPADWIMKHGLLMKHIYAHIHNSTAPHEEFEGGSYEGKRVVIMGGTQEDAIEVHTLKGKIKIPCKCLFPQRPSKTKGQLVAVISSEKAGEVFVANGVDSNSIVPLSVQGQGCKEGIQYTAHQTRLARCDLT